MAASAAVAGVLTGPRRRVDVAAATRHAIYLATGDPDCPALCLVDPFATRVPCAIVVRELPEPSDGMVGDGMVDIGPFTGRVTRWWRPPRPRGLGAARSRSVVASLSEVVPPEAPDVAALGYGPGLTPYADDVLAGALVTLAALDAPRFHALARETRILAPTRTTFVSAALLHHATRGECIPELADLLTGPGPVAPAVDRLLAVGGTSGKGLAQGVLAALTG
jgi:hypothetical protein